jgi:hypothetical protein
MARRSASSSALTVADFRDEALGSGFEVDMNLDARAPA